MKKKLLEAQSVVKGFLLFLDMLVNCEFCFVNIQIEGYFIDFGRHFFYGEIKQSNE